MYLGELFRSFLPLRNPLGFGVADFTVFAAACLLAVTMAGYALILPLCRRIAHRTAFVMILLTTLAVLLRLALLGTAPVPIAAGADDFSYLLLGDTLRHGRLANPTHPLPQFFESVFVLQQPTYSSIFPLGQGVALAVGEMLLGSSWAGVLLSGAALIALTYWMLRGWLEPMWALAGGLLALAAYGPLSPWTNSYWGGALSGCAGCLVFGALPRLCRATTPRKRWYAASLGAGLGLQWITRPFEAVLLAAAALFYWWFVAKRARPNRKLVLYASAPLALALLLTLLQNKSVTGSWTTLPYVISRYQYGVPATFTFQPNARPHHPLTAEQELDYRAQAAIHGYERDSVARFFERLVFRLRYLRFFVVPALYLAGLFFLPKLRARHFGWVLGSVALFLAGTNFYPYFFPHYIAAAGCLLLLMTLCGLREISRLPSRWMAHGGFAAGTLLCLCAAHFLFWYGIHASNEPQLLPAAAYDPWSFLNPRNPDGRRSVADRLATLPGQQLVFVRYAPQHRFSEWVANGADIDSSRVVWAHDLGVAENERLLRHLPNRKAWLLEPDATPPRLTEYADKPSSFEPVR